MRKFIIGACALLLLGSCSDHLTITSKGKSSYNIVIAPNADSLTMLAATQLQQYVARISGAVLPIVTPQQITNRDDKIITLGYNELLDTTGLGVAALGRDGFEIRTNNSGVVNIISNTPRGTINGVYTLLENYFGCRKYSATVEVIPSTAMLELPRNLADRQVPKITFRDTHYRGTNDQGYIDWHKLSHDSTGNKPDWGLWCHSFEQLVPPAEYMAKHPEYYSLIGGKRVPTQLCLSNPEVLEIACRNLATLMAAKPEANCWSVSSNDNFGYCQCPQCAAIDSIEGSPTGSVIRFVNAVAERFPDKTISTLAYQYSRAAPKVTRPLPNVNIMFCNIECNRSEAIATDSTSASFRRDMEEWAKLTDNILVWDYVVQFKNLVSPFPNLHTLQPNIQYFVDNNVVALFEQGNREVGGEFADLRAYLISKLLWEPNLDMDSLVTDFTDGFYGPAGVHVKEYINTLTSNLVKSGRGLYIFGSPCDAADSYLSADKMATYQAIFERAEAAVANQPDYLYRVQVARQPLYYAELEQARLDPYALHSIYIKGDNGQWQANPEYIAKLERFIALCKKEGVTRLSEWHTTPDEYLEMMSNMAQVRQQGNLAFEKPYTLNPAPAERYGRSADKVLTNGVHGSNDYTVQWLGWDIPRFEAVVDLGSVQKFKKVSAHYLQAQADWILFPKGASFSISDDGKSYRSIGSEMVKEAPRTPSVGSREYAVEGDFSGRYIKVVTDGLGECPSWHLGAGGKAWCFIDEIVVE